MIKLVQLSLILLMFNASIFEARHLSVIHGRIRYRVLLAIY
jgi:hypothetical protein